MESRQSVFSVVRNISKFFGVNFMLAKDEKWIAIVCIQFVFILFSSYFIYVFYLDFSALSKLYHVMCSIEIWGPLFLEICINIEAYSKTELEANILKQFEELETILQRNFNVKVNQAKIPCIKFISKFSLLLVVRLLKLSFAGVLFSTIVAISEIVCSVNDYMFSLYVNNLKEQIKIYTKNITSLNIKALDLKNDFYVLQKLARLINQRFYVSLTLSIILIFSNTVISFYSVYIWMSFYEFRLNGKF